MTKHTKEEIKNTVEKCLTNGIFSECKGCVYKGENPCIPTLVKDLFDYIDGLEAEIERLNTENQILSQKRMTIFERCEAYERGYNKGVEEFAKRLKEECSDHTTDNLNNPCVRILYDADEKINDIAKELVGKA